MARSASALARRAEKRGVPLELQKLKDAPKPTNNILKILKPNNNLNKITSEVTIKQDSKISTEDTPTPTTVTTPSARKNKKKVNKLKNIKKSDNSSKHTINSKSKFKKVDGDWDCPHCNNHNWTFRRTCNRCQRPKEFVASAVIASEMPEMLVYADAAIPAKCC